MTMTIELHDEPLEQRLLAYLVMHPATRREVASVLGQEDFAFPAHAAVFAALIDAPDASDSDTFARLRNHPALAPVGGLAYVSDLVENAYMGFIDPVGHAERIRDFAQRRDLLALVDKAGDSISAGHRTAIETIRALEADLLGVGMKRGPAMLSFASVLSDTLADAEAAYTAGDITPGCTTGFRCLDARLGGLRKGDLVILAARPSMGKTALAMNIATNASKAGESVLIFSMEMTAKSLMQRIISGEADVTTDQISRGHLGPEEWDRIAAVSSADWPMVICDQPNLSPSALRAEARKMQRDSGLDLIVVDYLQLMQPPGGDSHNRVNDVSAITRAMKQVAKELDVPILLLSQLSRAVEQREDKRPQLADLRDSGSIEQDADVVMFIYREEYYLSRSMPDEGSDAFPEWQSTMHAARGKAEIGIAKFRQGACGREVLRFDGRTTKFTDMSGPAASGMDEIPEQRQARRTIR